MSAPPSVIAFKRPVRRTSNGTVSGGASFAITNPDMDPGDFGVLLGQLERVSRAARIDLLTPVALLACLAVGTLWLSNAATKGTALVIVVAAALSTVLTGLAATHHLAPLPPTHQGDDTVRYLVLPDAHADAMGRHLRVAGALSAEAHQAVWEWLSAASLLSEVTSVEAKSTVGLLTEQDHERLVATVAHLEHRARRYFDTAFAANEERNHGLVRRVRESLTLDPMRAL